jgi:preprotein translocase subunit SecB
MTEPIDVKKVMQAVQLRDVRVVDVAANTTIRSPSETGNVDLFVDWAAKPKSRIGNEFVVEATLQARIARRESPNVPVVRIRTVFDLTYDLSQDVVASDEELSAFAKLNGTFNAWPYARALIQNLSASMNLPPITIPVFRVNDLARSIAQRRQPKQLTSKRESAEKKMRGKRKRR